MRRSLLVALVVLLALGVAPAAAHADFGIAPGSFTAQMLDGAGDPVTQAGAHPDRFRTSFAFNQVDGGADGNVKDLDLELPPGLAGDPTAVPVCPRAALAILDQTGCPPESQIGTIDLDIGTGTLSAAIYNAEPHKGDLAEFAFKAIFVAGHLFARTGLNGQVLTIEMARAVQDLPLAGITVELWGVPADHQSGSVAPRRAFLTAPTRCDNPPAVGARLRSWQQPDVWKTAVAQMGPLDGCEGLSFHPRVDFALASGAADTPTGTELDLLLPQSDDPDGQAGDRIRDIDLRLPEGMALSPSAANGLAACDEAAVHLGEKGGASCPAASTVGTVELSTPLLGDPVEGKVYMGRQLPGTDYRLFVVASAPARGIEVKLRLVLHADPVTGQLSTRISDLPELPFDRLTLRFAGGSRAALVNSPSCGASTVSAVFAPYGGGPSVASSDAASITTAPSGGPCPGVLPFAPTFVAGTSPARAGTTGALAVTIRRRDGEQSLRSFGMTLPAGLSARLGSVEQCSSAAAAAASCPLASRIGSLAVEAGSGPTPFPLGGDAYLTGPYRYAPFGLELAFRGVAGPFDLGTISVRAALDLDPLTGRVTVDSDPLPQIVRGIPLRMQTVALDIDRPGFMTNPTSCGATKIAATIESARGAISRSKSRFAVGGCRKLRFRPRMSMALTDRSELHKGGHPGMRLRLRPTVGGANIRDMSVALPRLLGPSVTGPTAICSLEQLKDDRCPSAAKIGSASGRTPLLSAPLNGSAYVVQPPTDDRLPDVWALMRGTGVSIKVRMKIARDDDGRLHGELARLPDMPLSSFAMALAGGKHGMFSTTRSPCTHGHAKRMPTRAYVVAHSGMARRLATRARVAPGC